MALLAGSALGKFLFVIMKLEKKRLGFTIENLRRLYPEKSDEELTLFVSKVSRHWGRFLLDNCGLPVLDKAEAEKLVIINGLERFDEEFNKGKGIMMATAHFGNFEIGTGTLALKGYPIHSVLRTVDNLALDRLMDKSRCATGLGVIKKENAAKEMIKALRKGEIVTTNVDLNASFNQVFVPFFGELAATFPTPAIMALKTGAPLIPAFTVRDDEQDCYYLNIYPPIEPPATGDRDADVRYMTMKINELLEDEIKKAPEQWHWAHRRWKARPDEKDIEAMNRETKIIDEWRKKKNAQEVSD